MDLEGIDAPMFVDFAAGAQHQVDAHVDHWFDHQQEGGEIEYEASRPDEGMAEAAQAALAAAPAEQRDAAPAAVDTDQQAIETVFGIEAAAAPVQAAVLSVAAAENPGDALAMACVPDVAEATVSSTTVSSSETIEGCDYYEVITTVVTTTTTTVTDEDGKETIVETTTTEEAADDVTEVAAEQAAASSTTTATATAAKAAPRALPPRKASTRRAKAAATAKLNRAKPLRRSVRRAASRKGKAAPAPVEAKKLPMAPRRNLLRAKRSVRGKASKAPAPTPAAAPAPKTAPAPKPTTRRPSSVRRGRSPAVPSTPRVLKRARSRSVSRAESKTSEELELEKIRKLREDATKRRKLSRRSFKKLSEATDYVPVRSSKPLTQPQEFEFKTDKVLSRRGSTRRASGSKPATGADPKPLHMYLRSHGEPAKAAPAGRPLQITRPKPFNFAQRLAAKQGKAAPSNKPFIPLAQQVQTFAKKTPERFRKKAAASDRFQPSGLQRVASQITVPESPQLVTKKRARSARVLSTAEQEEQMMLELKRNPFRAQGVNEQILQSRGDYGVPRIHKKELTKPEGMRLATEQRAKLRSRPQQAEEESKPEPFHARPAPRHILQPRLGHAAAYDGTGSTGPGFQAHPMPASAPFEPTHDRHHTEPEPFSFDGKYEHPYDVRRRALEVQMRAEEQGRHFTANPLPSEEPHQLPSVEHRGITVPEPFELPSHRIGEQRKHAFEEQVQAEQAELEHQASAFHATDATVTQAAPFVPKRSTKPLTNITDFSLNSGVRGEQRKGYDAANKDRLAAETDLLHQREGERQVQEAKEIRAHRRAIVHRANPVRHLPHLQVQPSRKRLTEPMSPMMGPVKRAMMRC